MHGRRSIGPVHQDVGSSETATMSLGYASAPSAGGVGRRAACIPCYSHKSALQEWVPTLLLPILDECFNTGTSGVCVSCCVPSSPAHMRPCKPTCCVPAPPMRVRTLQEPHVTRSSSGPAVPPTIRGRRRCMGSAHPRCELLLRGRVLQGAVMPRGC